MKCSKPAGTAAVFLLLAVLNSMPLTGAAGCGNNAALGTVNPNFADIGDGPVEPLPAVAPDNTDLVTVIEPGSPDQSGKIGTIADRDPSHVLCIIIDPASGENADLEACEADRVNSETDSVSGLCPDADIADHCASSNAGSVPDFCQVTGAADYVFVLINPTASAVSVAYQVIDVTAYPNKSCTDLNITEDAILSDE